MDQGEWDAVNGGEYFRILHADGGQIVDIEKTAVVDFIGRDPPEAQSISLIVEQLFQLIETVRIAFAAIDRGRALR